MLHNNKHDKYKLAKKNKTKKKTAVFEDFVLVILLTLHIMLHFCTLMYVYNHVLRY